MVSLMYMCYLSKRVMSTIMNENIKPQRLNIIIKDEKDKCKNGEMHE